jgi:hypothetical protein
MFMKIIESSFAKYTPDMISKVHLMNIIADAKKRRNKKASLVSVIPMKASVSYTSLVILLVSFLVPNWRTVRNAEAVSISKKTEIPAEHMNSSNRPLVSL